MGRVERHGGHRRLPGRADPCDGCEAACGHTCPHSRPRSLPVAAWLVPPPVGGEGWGGGEGRGEGWGLPQSQTTGEDRPSLCAVVARPPRLATEQET